MSEPIIDIYMDDAHRDLAYRYLQIAGRDMREAFLAGIPNRCMWAGILTLMGIRHNLSRQYSWQFDFLS